MESELIQIKDLSKQRGKGNVVKITNHYNEFILDINEKELEVPVDDLIKLAEDDSFEPEWFNLLYEWSGVNSGRASKRDIEDIVNELKKYI